MTGYKNTVDRIEVRKDTFFPSRPWTADVYFKDGHVWKSWCWNYRTKKSLLRHIEAVDSDLPALVVTAPAS